MVALRREPGTAWDVLKTRLKAEGSELATNCSQLKMMSSDGKYYETDVLDTKGILRLIQSVPSKKAEPFKMWLAEVGNDRLNEIADPEKAIVRGAEFYRKKGYPEGWINQRLQTIEMRKEYAILTFIISLLPLRSLRLCVPFQGNRPNCFT